MDALVTGHLAAVFLAPALAAAGVAAVGVPVAIHLLSRVRRREEPWAAMRFLLEAYKQQKNRMRFEQWVLLALRCLIVLVLGLALAGPVSRGVWGWLTGVPAGADVHVVVDDGLASGVEGRMAGLVGEAERVVGGGVGGGFGGGRVGTGWGRMRGRWGRGGARCSRGSRTRGGMSGGRVGWWW